MEEDFTVVIGPLPRAEARTAFERWRAALPRKCAERLRDDDIRIECVKTKEGRLRILYRIRATCLA